MSKQEVWTSEDLKKHMKLKAKKAKESKYKNNPKYYQGVLYHSTKEANYAATLDLLLKAGDVIKWERQLSYKLGFNDVYITEYRLDFKIWWNGGRIEHIDVKGVKTGAAYRTFLIKKALMKSVLGIDVIEV